MSSSPIPSIQVAYGDPHPAGCRYPWGSLFPLDAAGGDFPGSRIPHRGAAARGGPTAGPVARRLGALGPAGFRGARSWTLPGASGYPRPPGPAVTLEREGDRWILASDRLRVALCETGPGCWGNSLGTGIPTWPPRKTCTSPWTTPRPGTKPPDGARIGAVVAPGPPAGRRSALPPRRRAAPALPPGPRGVGRLAGAAAGYHYFNLEPGQAAQHLECIALESAWQLGPETQRHFLQTNYGLFYVSRHVFNPAPVALAADFSRASAHVEDPAMLRTTSTTLLSARPAGGYPRLARGRRCPARRLPADAGFLVARPNRLTSAGNLLAAEVWPRTAGPLELPQGRSRRQTLTFAFVQRGEEAQRGWPRPPFPRAAPGSGGSGGQPQRSGV